VEKSPDFAAQVFLELNALWTTLVKNLGAEEAPRMASVEVYVTGATPAAARSLQHRFRHTLLYRAGGLRFGRPDFPAVMHRELLCRVREQLEDDPAQTRPVQTLVAFCGGEQLGAEIKKCVHDAGTAAKVIPGCGKQPLDFVHLDQGVSVGYLKDKKKQGTTAVAPRAGDAPADEAEMLPVVATKLTMPGAAGGGGAAAGPAAADEVALAPASSPKPRAVSFVNNNSVDDDAPPSLYWTPPSPGPSVGVTAAPVTDATRCRANSVKGFDAALARMVRNARLAGGDDSLLRSLPTSPSGATPQPPILASPSALLMAASSPRSGGGRSRSCRGLSAAEASHEFESMVASVRLELEDADSSLQSSTSGTMLCTLYRRRRAGDDDDDDDDDGGGADDDDANTQCC